MPAIAFIPAVVGSAFYGALISIVLYLIYGLRGAPGSTGMEILVVPIMTVEAMFVGSAAAIISLFVPRARFAGSDNFIVLVFAAILLQTLFSLPAFLINQGNPPPGTLMWCLSMSGPVDWTSKGFNWSWLYLVPLTLTVCSPWFRSRFDPIGR